MSTDSDDEYPYKVQGNDPRVHGLEVVPGIFDYSGAVACEVAFGWRHLPRRQDVAPNLPPLGREQNLSIRRGARKKPSAFSRQAVYYDEASGGFMTARPARLLTTASNSAGSTGFAK
jgi:hypothetical protein